MRLASIFCILVVGCSASTSTPSPAEEQTTPPVGSSTPQTGETKPAGSITLIANDGVLASASFPTQAASREPLARGCTISAIDMAPRGPLDSDDVGRIDIALASAQPGLVLAYDAAKHAYGDAFSGALPEAGSAVRVHGDAFDGSVAAVAAPELTAPAEGAAIADDGTDLTVAWTPTSEPLFIVTVSLGTKTITCNFDGASGHDQVPAALVHDALQSAPAAAQMVAIAGRTTTLEANDRDVYVTYEAVTGRSLAIPAAH